jgi:hypothetical protein
VVIGVRNSEYYKNVPFTRKAISLMFRFILKSFFKIPYWDTQCGLKGFNKKGKEIFLSTRTRRFLFDMEFIYYCMKEKNNIRVSAVRADLKPGIKFSSINLKILAVEGYNFLKIILVPGKSL